MAYRILIVDDAPALQNMVKEILTQAGYETDAALSCAQALERFRAAAPDAVLLDVMLPDGDGFSLLGTLRELRDVPVLFLSARDEDEARLKGLGLVAIYNKNEKIIYSSNQYDPKIEGNLFTQAIFPNDPPAKINYLKVYFPTKRDYISSSVKFMIPSFAFTFILLVTFLFTIITAFRQKKLTEMKNDFINNMTHEFKTPISTISLAAQMLNDPSVAKSPAMFQHISGVINDETKRLRFQVEKVLQMSMFDRQKTLMKLHNVDVNDLVAGVMSTFKLKVEKYGGVIAADLEAEDAIVSVDEMHFTNVIFNLLDNAVKYRREEEPLSLFIRTRTVGDKVEISIRYN